MKVFINGNLVFEGKPHEIVFEATDPVCELCGTLTTRVVGHLRFASDHDESHDQRYGWLVDCTKGSVKFTGKVAGVHVTESLPPEPTLAFEEVVAPTPDATP